MLRNLIDITIIVLVSLACFSNTLENSFHLDDFYRVQDNPGIQSIAPLWRHFVEPRPMSTLDRIKQFRPLLPLTLSFNYYFRGEHIAGYHLVTLALQTITTIFVFLFHLELLTRWVGNADEQKGRSNELIAFLAALTFAIHPVSGILVNYICAPDLILMQFFMIPTLLIYARMRRRVENSLLSWISIFKPNLLSILSKTDTAMLPAIIFLFEIFLNKKT
ncbi:MAG: hypothetical protein IT292_10700 [Deltaproteobacteria bacterium]|nr:hypothetical protein [Deltaproteobacteria bacterium]